MKRKANSLDRLLGRKKKRCTKNLPNSFVPEQILCPRDGVHTLQTLAAKVAASHIPFELIEKRLPSIPEPVLEKILYFSFPQNESDIYFYSCQSHIDKKKSSASGITDAEKLPFNLGLNILDMGLVQDVTQIGFHLSGNVADQCRHITLKHCRSCCGYKVSVSFDRGKITSVRCACGGKGIFWCQHVVALILFRIRRPTQVAFRKPISDSLDQLDRIQLQKLTQYLLAASSEDLVPHAQAIVDELMAPKSKINQIWGAPDPTGGVSISQSSNWYLDENQVREQVRHHLANLVSSGSVGNLHVGSFVASTSFNLAASASNVTNLPGQAANSNNNSGTLSNFSTSNSPYVPSTPGTFSAPSILRPNVTGNSNGPGGTVFFNFSASATFPSVDENSGATASGPSIPTNTSSNTSSISYGPVVAISLMCDKVRQMFARSDPNGTRMLTAMTNQFLKDPRLQSFKLRRTEIWQDYHRMWQELTSLWLTVLGNPRSQSPRQQWLFQLRRWSQHPLCPTEHMGFHYEPQTSTEGGNGQQHHPALNDSDASSNSGGSSSVSTVGTVSVLDEVDMEDDDDETMHLDNIRLSTDDPSNGTEPRSIFHFAMDAYFWSWDSPIYMRILNEVSEDEEIRTRFVFDPAEHGESFAQVCHRVYTLFCHGHLLASTALALALCRHLLQEWHEQMQQKEVPVRSATGNRFHPNVAASSTGMSHSVTAGDLAWPLQRAGVVEESSAATASSFLSSSQPLVHSTLVHPSLPTGPSLHIYGQSLPHRITMPSGTTNPPPTLPPPTPPRSHPHLDHSTEVPYNAHGWLGITGNPLVCIIECLLDCRNSPLVTRHTWSVEAMDRILAEGYSYLSSRHQAPNSCAASKQQSTSSTSRQQACTLTNSSQSKSSSSCSNSSIPPPQAAAAPRNVGLGVGRLSCEDLLLCCAFQLGVMGLCQQRVMPPNANCQEKALSQESHLLAVLEQMMPLNTNSNTSTNSNNNSSVPGISASSRGSSGPGRILNNNSAPSCLLLYAMVSTVRTQMGGNSRSGLGKCIYTESFPMHRAALYLFPRLLSIDQELAFAMGCRALRLPVLEARSDSEENLDLLLLLSEHRSRWSVMRQVEASQCELALLMLLRGAQCSKINHGQMLRMASSAVMPPSAPAMVILPQQPPRYIIPGGQQASSASSSCAIRPTAAAAHVTLVPTLHPPPPPAPRPGGTAGWHIVPHPQACANSVTRFTQPPPPPPPHLWSSAATGNSRNYLVNNGMGPPPPPPAGGHHRTASTNVVGQSPNRFSVTLARQHSLPSVQSSSHIRLIPNPQQQEMNSNYVGLTATTGNTSLNVLAGGGGGGGGLLQHVLYTCDRHIHTALSLYHLSQEVMNKSAGNTALTSAAYHLALSVCRRTLQSLNWRRREMLQYTVTCALENGVNAVLYLLTNWWCYVKPREAVCTVLPAIMNWSGTATTNNNSNSNSNTNNNNNTLNSNIGNNGNTNNKSNPTKSTGTDPTRHGNNVWISNSPLMKDERVLQAWRQVLVHVVLRDPIHCSIQALTLCDKDPLTFDSLVRLITDAAEQGSIGCVQLFLIARYLKNEAPPNSTEQTGTRGGGDDGNTALSSGSAAKAFRLALQAVRMTRLSHLQDRHPSTVDILWCCGLAQSLDVQAVEEFLQHVIRNIHCPSLLADILQRCIYQPPPPPRLGHTFVNATPAASALSSTSSSSGGVAACGQQTAQPTVWEKVPTLRQLLEATLNAYVAATHARLGNISPRQYTEFLDFLTKAYDTFRLLPSGKGLCEFHNLLEAIRHAYRGKRKLMQLIAERFHV